MKPREEELLEYDVQKRAKAGTRATLRAVVALYLMYLGSELLRTVGDEASAFPSWAGWLFGLLFIAAGTVFGAYTWQRYKKEREEARLLPPEESEEEEEDPRE